MRRPTKDNQTQYATSRISAREDRRVTLRFKSEEWSVIQSDIEDAGLNINEYFRQCTLDAPKPRHVKRKSLDGYGQIYSQWLGQLGKIGGNVNQISRHLNASRKAGHSASCPSNAEVLAVLEEVLLLLQESGQQARTASTVS